MRRVFSAWVVGVVLVIAAGASPASANSLTLAWDPPTDGMTSGYIIWYGTASGEYTTGINVGNVTTWRVEGLLDGTTYYFAVQAYESEGGVSELSAEVSGRTSGTSPSGGGGPGARPPTHVVASLRANRFVDISWTPLGSGSSYRVEVGTASGQTAYSAVTTQTDIIFDSYDLPAPVYYVRVREVFGGVPGVASNEVIVNGVSPGSCIDAPGAPRRFIVGANGSAVRLAWQSGSVPPSSYVLQVGSAPGLQNLLTAEVPEAQNWLNATATDGVYALRLVANNPCGTSLWGAETLLRVGNGGTSMDVPGAPQALTQQVTGSLVSLSWAAPTSGGLVTRYLIEALTTAGPVALDTGSPATSFSHPNTPPGQYVITVRAGNAGGFGPPSAPVTVIVP